MAEEETGQTYNGWTNYPTWCVNLWLSNDQGLYNETRELVANVQPYSHRAADDLDRRAETASALQRFVEDLCPDLGASFPADLLSYVLHEVDWYEIAESWLEQAREEAVRS